MISQLHINLHIYTFFSQANHSPSRQQPHHHGNHVNVRGGGSRGNPKSTLMAVSIIAVVSVVYANCNMPPWADIIIEMPDNSKLGQL